MHFYSNIQKMTDNKPIIASIGIDITTSPMITRPINTIGRAIKISRSFASPHAILNARVIRLPYTAIINRINNKVTIMRSFLTVNQSSSASGSSDSSLSGDSTVMLME